MKNFTQPGENITFPAAPRALKSGDGFIVGSRFAVAAGDAAEDAEVVGSTCGCFDLPKADAQAWAFGAKIYWDNANHRATTVAQDNKLIGTANEVVTNAQGNTTGNVQLNGVSLP